MPEEIKKRTAKELIEANIDDLTNEELDRRAAVIRASQAEADLQDIKERLAERKNKREEKEEKYKTRGRELQKTSTDQDRHQNQCSHRKGGRGLEALQRGGNAADYAVIRHVLPTNELWQRCQRCGKTWKPPHRVDFPKGQAGDQLFAAAKEEYKTAISWPTDNIQSSGITFAWSDNGEFAHEMMKDATLR